jgi:hypothetical protein
MSKSKFTPAEQVTIVNAKGTRLRVSAALARKMRGYSPATSAAADDGTPSESWTATKLKAYAAANDIDLAGATRKADILDALAAAADPDNDPAEGDEDGEDGEGHSQGDEEE